MTVVEPHVRHHHIAPEVLLRPAVIIGLLGIGLIHFLDVFGKFKEVPYMGVLYVVLIGACVVASGLLLRRDGRAGWVLAGLVATATLAGYVASRTVGLPAATDDIGNWMEPLGLASLFVEGLVAATSAIVLASLRRSRTSGA